MPKSSYLFSFFLESAESLIQGYSNTAITDDYVLNLQLLIINRMKPFYQLEPVYFHEIIIIHLKYKNMKYFTYI